jgi:hypothetical protein
MPKLGNALDFVQLEAKNLRAHQANPAPAAPVAGQLYYNNVNNTLFWFNGTSWVGASGAVDATPSVKGVIQLAGDLSGTAASPQIANQVITDANIESGNIDGTPTVPSLRTLGTGAFQSCAGNDLRLTNARTPQGVAGGGLAGGYPDPTIAADAVGLSQCKTELRGPADNVLGLRRLGFGAAEAMSGGAGLDDISAATPGLGDVNLNGFALFNVQDPTLGHEAATKQYVDSVAEGLDVKASVKCATTANIVITTALNSGDVIDGVTLAGGDRVLVKDQTTTNQNGIYVVSLSPQRSSEMDQWDNYVSAFTFVEQGTANADTGWVCTVDAGGTLGTTPITWSQFSGAGAGTTAGAGLTKTGNTLDVGAGAGITVNADDVQVANNGITNAMLADGAVNLASADVSNTLPILRGGTGQTTAKAARETGLSGAGYYSSATHGAGTTITITAATHGLRASRGLIVQCQTEADGAVELPDVTVAANGDVTVSFGVSVTANSRRITVIG